MWGVDNMYYKRNLVIINVHKDFIHGVIYKRSSTLRCLEILLISAGNSSWSPLSIFIPQARLTFQL